MKHNSMYLGLRIGVGLI